MTTATKSKPPELSTMAVLEKYILGTSRFMEIPSKDLHVDHKYQRDLNENALKRIVSDFNIDLFEPPTVNDRTGWKGYKGFRFALIDGQHRKAAAVRLKLPTMTCRIVTVSPDKEAKMFVELNRQRTWLTPMQAFKAELEQGNPACVEIAACLAERGLRVLSGASSNPNGSEVYCVTAMKRIYAQRGYVGLSRVLDIALLSWPADDNRRFSAQIMLGLDNYLSRNGKTDHLRLSEKLSMTTSRQLIARGTARWHAWQGLGEKTGKSVIDATADEIGKAYRKR